MKYAVGVHRVLSWLAPLVLLGCRSAEPVEAWCSDPVFDDAPWVSEFTPCPEHADSFPEAEKVGECGRFDMLWWVHPTASKVYFQARSDGSFVGVRVEDLRTPSRTSLGALRAPVSTAHAKQAWGKEATSTTEG